MKALTFSILVLFIHVMLYCNLLEVDINGNYDYTSIQDAIESAENGDDILVYPGIYYENIDYLGKQLQLTSLFHGTGERHYIKETIINGNGSGSCLRNVCNESGISIISGFTLTNGIGSYYNTDNRYLGGGVYVYNSQLNIISCIIENNIAEVGGGLSISNESEVILSDIIIRNNQAISYGGGLRFNTCSDNIEFDNENRCSIYNNYSPKGADIYCQYEGGTEVVYLDTLTAADYEGYYIFQYIESPPGFTLNGLTIDYLNTWIELVDADLYVSPEGDDNNSGLSWEEPMKSITWAMQKIAVNPQERHTVFLGEGVYSNSDTGEKMPFQAKDCTTISGDSIENTTIDGENKVPFFNINYGEYYFGMENLRFINAGADFLVNQFTGYGIRNKSTYDGELMMRDIIFEYNDVPHSLLLFPLSNSAVIENIVFRNNGINKTPGLLNLYSYNDEGEQIDDYLNNIFITNNNTGKMIFMARLSNGADFYVSNLVFTGNLNEDPGCGFDVNGTILGLADGANCYLINSTIANNISDTPPISSAILLCNFSSIEVINSIIYNNGTDYEINSINYIEGYTVNVHHSLIENGRDGVHGILPIIWDYDTNLDCNPEFTGNENHLLSLQDDSPCVDAGTTVMPEGFTLPETDIMGNQRIMGNGIDMGAYEYNPWSSPVNEELNFTDLEFYPNPVRLQEGRGTLIIKYPATFNQSGYAIKIYNVKGQKVWETDLKTGYNSIRWDCRNQQGKTVGTGVYFLRLQKDGVYISQEKVSLIK